MTFARIEDSHLDGLIGWWDLQERSGTTASEVLLDSAAGVLTLSGGDLSFGSGTNGPNALYPNAFWPNSMSAAGTPGYLNAAARITTGAVRGLTVAAWVKPVNTPSLACICSEWDNAGDNRSWLVGNASGFPVVQLSSAGSVIDVEYTAADIVELSTWTRRVYSWDFMNQEIHMYDNGLELPGTFTVGMSVIMSNDGSEPFHLHANSLSQNTFNQGISALRVWQRYMTPEEVEYDYALSGGVN